MAGERVSKLGLAEHKVPMSINSDHGLHETLEPIVLSVFTRQGGQVEIKAAYCTFCGAVFIVERGR